MSSGIQIGSQSQQPQQPQASGNPDVIVRGPLGAAYSVSGTIFDKINTVIDTQPFNANADELLWYVCSRLSGPNEPVDKTRWMFLLDAASQPSPDASREERLDSLLLFFAYMAYTQAGLPDIPEDAESLSEYLSRLANAGILYMRPDIIADAESHALAQGAPIGAGGNAAIDRGWWSGSAGIAWWQLNPVSFLGSVPPSSPNDVQWFEDHALGNRDLTPELLQAVLNQPNDDSIETCNYFANRIASQSQATAQLGSNVTLGAGASPLLVSEQGSVLPAPLSRGLPPNITTGNPVAPIISPAQTLALPTGAATPASVTGTPTFTSTSTAAPFSGRANASNPPSTISSTAAAVSTAAAAAAASAAIAGSRNSRRARWESQDAAFTGPSSASNRPPTPIPMAVSTPTSASAPTRIAGAAQLPTCFQCLARYRPVAVERLLGQWRDAGLRRAGIDPATVEGINVGPGTVPPQDPQRAAAYGALSAFAQHASNIARDVVSNTAQTASTEAIVAELLPLANGNAELVGEWLDGFADNPHPTSFYNVFQERSGFQGYVTCGNCALNNAAEAPSGALRLPGAASAAATAGGQNVASQMFTRYESGLGGGGGGGGGPDVVIALGPVEEPATIERATRLPASLYKGWDDWFSRYAGPYGIRIGSIALARSAQTSNLTLVRVVGYAPQLLGVPDPARPATDLYLVGRKPFAVLATPLYPPPSAPTTSSAQLQVPPATSAASTPAPTPPSNANQRGRGGSRRGGARNREVPTASASAIAALDVVKRALTFTPAAFAFDAIYPALGPASNGDLSVARVPPWDEFVAGRAGRTWALRSAAPNPIITASRGLTLSQQREFIIAAYVASVSNAPMPQIQGAPPIPVGVRIDDQEAGNAINDISRRIQARRSRNIKLAVAYAWDAIASAEDPPDAVLSRSVLRLPSNDREAAWVIAELLNAIDRDSGEVEGPWYTVEEVLAALPPPRVVAQGGGGGGIGGSLATTGERGVSAVQSRRTLIPNGVAVARYWRDRASGILSGTAAGLHYEDPDVLVRFARSAAAHVHAYGRLHAMPGVSRGPETYTFEYSCWTSDRVNWTRLLSSFGTQAPPFPSDHRFWVLCGELAVMRAGYLFEAPIEPIPSPWQSWNTVVFTAPECIRNILLALPNLGATPPINSCRNLITMMQGDMEGARLARNELLAFFQTISGWDPGNIWATCEAGYFLPTSAWNGDRERASTELLNAYNNLSHRLQPFVFVPLQPQPQPQPLQQQLQPQPPSQQAQQQLPQPQQPPPTTTTNPLLVAPAVSPTTAAYLQQRTANAGETVTVPPNRRPKHSVTTSPQASTTTTTTATAITPLPSRPAQRARSERAGAPLPPLSSQSLPLAGTNNNSPDDAVLAWANAFYNASGDWVTQDDAYRATLEALSNAPQAEVAYITSTNPQDVAGTPQYNAVLERIATFLGQP